MGGWVDGMVRDGVGQQDPSYSEVQRRGGWRWAGACVHSGGGTWGRLCWWWSAGGSWGGVGCKALIPASAVQQRGEGRRRAPAAPLTCRWADHGEQCAGTTHLHAHV
jgi:hypothetical protein